MHTAQKNDSPFPPTCTAWFSQSKSRARVTTLATFDFLNSTITKPPLSSAMHSNSRRKKHETRHVFEFSERVTGTSVLKLLFVKGASAACNGRQAAQPGAPRIQLGRSSRPPRSRWRHPQSLHTLQRKFFFTCSTRPPESQARTCPQSCWSGGTKQHV